MFKRSVIFTANFSIFLFCFDYKMDIRRYMKRKDEFDEVDEQPSLKRKTGAQKVAASHHGCDADTNESTGVQDAVTDGEHAVNQYTAWVLLS